MELSSPKKGKTRSPHMRENAKISVYIGIQILCWRQTVEEDLVATLSPDDICGDWWNASDQHKSEIGRQNCPH
jgi:hypothetical protein